MRLVGPDPASGNVCDDHTGPVERLGMGDYMWLVETNSNSGATCPAPGRCSTQFYGPLGSAAAFNTSAVLEKGRVISREVRALRNVGAVRTVGPRERIGVTGYGPNINILRDPRFGRASELPGEDPFLSGTYAAAMVRGMQEEDDKGRPRMLAFLKHFAAYSTETDRMHAQFRVSAFDLFDTYLRQFEIASRHGRPAGAMCSYAGVNGRMSCSNGFLLNDVFRTRWGQPDAVITSDCGAVQNLLELPVGAARDNATAAAWAMANGTDLEMGSAVFRNPLGLAQAVAGEQLDEKLLDRAVRRLYRLLFRGGLFDPPGHGKHDALGLEDINTTEARAAAYDIALQAPVLLRNDRLQLLRGGERREELVREELAAPEAAAAPGRQRLDQRDDQRNAAAAVLPLDWAQSVAVLGPLADSWLSTYDDYAINAQPCFNGGSWPNFKRACIRTVLDGVRRHRPHCAFNEGLRVAGPGDACSEVDPTALQLGAQAQAVVLVVGSDMNSEQEGVDRQNTDLQPCQEAFARQVLALRKPTVVLLLNGGQLSVDFLAAHDAHLAVVEAFSPNAQAADALADLLFGLHNRWGKLPVTLYPSSFQREQNVTDFDMSKPPGRTYRYYTGLTLWPFGHGLRYTSFALERCDCAPTKVSCSLRNTGHREGDEVVQFYHAPAEPLRDALRAKHPVPIRTLVAYRRVALAKGQAATVDIDIDEALFHLTDEQGQRKLYHGQHHITVHLGTLGGSTDPGAPSCAYTW